jgi:hypothetical protein
MEQSQYKDGSILLATMASRRSGRIVKTTLFVTFDRSLPSAEFSLLLIPSRHKWMDTDIPQKFRWRWEHYPWKA